MDCGDIRPRLAAPKPAEITGSVGDQRRSGRLLLARHHEDKHRAASERKDQYNRKIFEHEPDPDGEESARVTTCLQGNATIVASSFGSTAPETAVA
jgi:hypothetical protein